MSAEEKNEQILEEEIQKAESDDAAEENGAVGEEAAVEDDDAVQVAAAGENGVSAPEEEAAPEPSEAEIIADLEQKLAAAEAKSEEYLDRLQRTAAEFQNSKRRQEKQLTQQIERANERLIRQLLPVLDDFEQAFRNVPDEHAGEDNAWIAGFYQIQKKLLHVLEEEEVTPIPAEGEFDPNRHEAVSSEPNEDVESGHIIETLRTGYEYKGQVLRPALVRVAL